MDYLQSASALHGIMDQGGLFELLLSPDSMDSTQSIPTRTIGDVSTGTASPLPVTPPEDKPPSPARPQLIEESSSQTIMPSSLAKRPSNDMATQATKLTPVGEVGHNPIASASTTNASSPTPDLIPPGMPVLVVDDDALTRRLMGRMLTRLGCEVATAENGEAAIELIIHPPGADTGKTRGPKVPWNETSTYAVVFLDNQASALPAVAAIHAEIS